LFPVLQRTLEQSVDEFLHGKAHLEEAKADSNAQPQDVDSKIQQQIQEFECENQKKKNEVVVVETAVTKEISAEVVNEFSAHCHTHVLTLDRFEKPFEVLEEVKESEEESGSLKKKPDTVEVLAAEDEAKTEEEKTDGQQTESEISLKYNNDKLMHEFWCR
jgi:hypothetical protein